MHKPLPVTIHLGLGGQLRHSIRHLVEGVLVPLGLFYLLLTLTGMTGGLFAALGWGLAALGWRLVWRSPVPAVLLLTTGMLAVRTVIGYFTGSVFLYFLQPTLQNFLIAFVLLVSLPFNRPLIAKLADDFCAFPTVLTNNASVQRFFRRVSLLWACVFIANGGATLWALVRIPLGGFLLVATVGKIALVGFAAVASLLWFRRELRGAGIRLSYFVRSESAAVAPAST